MLRPIQWQITMLKAGQEDQLSKDAASSASQFAMRKEAIEMAERERSQVKRKENSSGTNKLVANDRNASGNSKDAGKKKRKSQSTKVNSDTNTKEIHKGLDIYA